MNGKPLWPLIVVVGLFVAIGFAQRSGSAPAKPTGPDLSKVFDGSWQARHDARVLATMCRSLHNMLKLDWESEKPLIKSGAEVDNLRVITRRVRMTGKSYLETYPDLKGVLEAHFEAHVGKSGGPLTAETKAGWLKAYSELADACDYAAGAR